MAGGEAAARWTPVAGAAAIAVAVFAAGCATYRDALRRTEQELAANRPQAALAALEGLKGGRDHVLYLLNKGMVARMAGELRTSIAAFEEAKPLMADLEALSVSETAGSLILNENVRAYAGEVYERLLLHVYQALNHLELGDPHAARVEALQVDLILRRLYPATERAPHGGDAFARYLSGLIFEALGEEDDAMIAYRHAYQSYLAGSRAVPRDLQRRLLRFAARLGLQDELRAYRKRFGNMEVAVGGTDDNGELVLVLSSGLAPLKVEHSVMTQDPATGRLYRISLPQLVPRPPAVSAMRVVAGGVSARSEQVEDVARSALDTLAAQIPALTARAIARNVARDYAARKVGEEHGQGFELLVSFAGAAIEQADTRAWTTLPDHIELATLSLPAGRHDVEVELLGAAGVVERRRFTGVEIPAGSLRFLSIHSVTR
ncbi:MAG TPA: hypothetical protein VNL72_00215 [Gammaproteobacteria bacterium]|nr:hypothetical protein [Gammaproteobacteria bacterium]